LSSSINTKNERGLHVTVDTGSPHFPVFHAQICFRELISLWCGQHTLQKTMVYVYGPEWSGQEDNPEF